MTLAGSHTIDVPSEMISRVMIDFIIGINEDGHPYSMRTKATVKIVKACLLASIVTRTLVERDTVWHMWANGEYDIATRWKEPDWWNHQRRCCRSPWKYHLIYSEQHGPMHPDAVILCPYGRGYWNMARLALIRYPETLREIAAATAQHIAPVWRHHE